MFQSSRLSDLPVQMSGTHFCISASLFLMCSDILRYQDQVQRETAAFKAPLARPESSMTLATLNLEVGGYRHHINPLTPVALMPGPTLACPPEEVGCILRPKQMNGMREWSYLYLNRHMYGIVNAL